MVTWPCPNANESNAQCELDLHFMNYLLRNSHIICDSSIYVPIIVILLLTLLYFVDPFSNFMCGKLVISYH